MDSDDDDQYMTLKDVDHIRMDHDDLAAGTPVKVEEVEEVATEESLSKLPLNSPELFGDQLEAILGQYNEQAPPGQETVLDPSSGVCRGFVRVELNLSRPINVASPGGPPSVYNLTKEDSLILSSEGGGERTLTTFYLPPSTVKALHVTTDTTTSDVIQALLGKFRVADNPHKYALYEKSLR